MTSNQLHRELHLQDIPVDDQGTELREFRIGAWEAERTGAVTRITETTGKPIAVIVPVSSPAVTVAEVVQVLTQALGDINGPDPIVTRMDIVRRNLSRLVFQLRQAVSGRR